ncbi:hypothetical protein ONZ45_g4263 [Pleurotus djamor]|nr:hypothetical protein ONZ45_g4263 [Pleurotus djamor]
MDDEAYYQAQLIARLRVNLEGAVLESESLASTMCPDLNRTQAVLTRLQIMKVCKITGDNVTISSWPAPGRPEREFYKPLAGLCNGIRHAFQTEHSAAARESRFFRRKLKFYAFNREMLESVGYAFPLKPDLLTSGEPIKEGTAKPSWLSVDMPGVVEDDWPAMIAQAATYARACFGADDSRYFIPVLTFHQTNAEFRLCFFHRGGILATPCMKLLTTKGFTQFVSTLVGIFNWATPQEAGLCATQSHSHFSINNQCFQIADVLCRRNPDRGRATRVFTLRRDDQDAPLPWPPKAILRRLGQVDDTDEGQDNGNDSEQDPYISENDDTGTQEPESEEENKEMDPEAEGEDDSDVSEEAAEETNQRKTRNPYPPLEPLMRSESLYPEETVSAPDIDFPSTIVAKCSYPLTSRPSEMDVFASLDKYIGVVRILHVHDAERLTIPSDATHWNIFGDGNGTQAPEERIHRHIFFETHGRPLHFARGPRELGKAILHAMIGHYAIFKINKMVHRDVSIGNILLLSKPELRAIPPGLENIVTAKHMRCVAVLADGDAAREWRCEAETSTQRSGTLPFIAHRILTIWKTLGERTFHHLPLDDLESFVWVLFYALLERKDRLNDTDRTWWIELRDDTLAIVAGAKSSVFDAWTTPLLKPRMSPSFAPFYKLLRDWLRTAQHYKHRIQRITQRHKKPTYEQFEPICDEAYQRYIEAGVKRVSALPVSW